MRGRAKILPVLLLLALAAADLLVPGLCLAEAPGPIGTDASSGLPFEGELDDCFCCCAHVVTEDVETWDRAVQEVTLVDESADEVPLAGPTPLFHPPRA